LDADRELLPWLLLWLLLRRREEASLERPRPSLLLLLPLLRLLL